MNPIKSARIRLTVWYVLIIALISFSFSAIIYNGVASELERGFQMAEYRINNPRGGIIPRSIALIILQEDFENARRSVIMSLLKINGGILITSGIASYILAGRSIKPIENMLEEQKRFTADAGHELKTPLTALRTEIEVALRDKKFSLKDAKKLLQSNLEEVVSLQKLSENLMLLNKYAQKNHSLSFKEIDIKGVVSKAVGIVQPLARNKNIKIVNSVESRKVKGDAQSLTELFVILIDNAVKYSHEKSEVKIQSEIKKSKMAIEVIDEGIGITKSEQEHIFDRFYRADSSRCKENTNGYGLGLAIAKEIIDRHNGSIGITSSPNQGSRFSVFLPLS